MRTVFFSKLYYQIEYIVLRRECIRNEFIYYSVVGIKIHAILAVSIIIGHLHLVVAGDIMTKIHMHFTHRRKCTQ